MEPPSVFKYGPLEPKRSIRLLRISDSDKWDDPIAVSLTTRLLSEGAFRPKYNALSYTWGDSGRKVEVSIDGARIMITESLSEALRHLRRTQQHRDDIGGLWWVDMLCIDQQCIPERNHQVAMMRDIFQSATLVAAWLGTDRWFEPGIFANSMLQAPAQASGYLGTVDHSDRAETRPTLPDASEFLNRPSGCLSVYHCMKGLFVTSTSMHTD